MGRRKCFNEEKVLDTALDCFWRNGLKASSIRTLADEMGIAGPSLYNTYGCKQALFAKALQRYVETSLRPRFERVRHLPPLDAIRAFLEDTVEIALTDADGKGCLVVNTVIETASEENELTKTLRIYLDEVKGFYSTNVQAAKDRGDLSADMNPGEVAELFFIIMLGICVRARTKPTRPELEAALAPALSLLAAKS
jgi:TetR/AcrR family transcriptional repressor of nem operon